MAEYGRIHTDGSRSGGQPVLLPCPFCGRQCATLLIDQGTKWAHYEPSCLEVRTGYNLSNDAPWRDEAIAAWNTRQPTHSNIFDVSDVQKHTLIVEQDYASHTVEVKSLDDSQPTQSDALQADIDAMESILWVDTIIDDKEAIAKAFARHRQRGYEAGVKAAAKALLADAKLCDCAALEERECACGAWDDYKSITSARAVEIVRALQGQSK